MNQIFTHPGQPEMQAEVILASATPNAPTIYTIRARYPRIIHSEIMTHRVFGRNARSSRAVPVARMIQEIREKPFIPWHWGKNQKGMQAAEECDAFIPIEGLDELTREDAWQWMADYSADTAEAFAEAGYHKQICNRLLEPFMWIDMLITATNWENFLWLRDHKDAEPHLQDLARLVRRALETAEPQELKSGEWHLPYITAEEQKLWGGSMCQHGIPFLAKLSAARCARISYAPFDGDGSHAREMERYELLVSSDRVHASPLEHQATPDTRSDRFSAEGELVGDDWDEPHRHGNLDGWVQHRKLVPNEAVSG